MPALLSEERVLRLLKQAIRGAGGQHRYAETRGISQTIVSTSLTGKRRMSPKVLRTLGLRKTTAYEWDQ